METLLLFLWIAPMVVTAIVARQKAYRLLLWVPLAFKGNLGEPLQVYNGIDTKRVCLCGEEKHV